VSEASKLLVYYNHTHVRISLSTQLSHATAHSNLQNKVDTHQDKVGTLQDKVIDLENKLNTFQNTTQASTMKHHHEVVELLQNTSCSSDGKT